MKNFTRREAIKRTGQVAAGAALAIGTGSIIKSKLNDDTPVISDADLTLYDTGNVPISSSGWVKAKGLSESYAALNQDITTDVLVIGAGLAGSSLVLHLSEQNINTVLIEARQPGWGASGRNAGHVLPLLKDFDVFETFPDKGKAFLELFSEHHSIPFDIAEKYGIDCDASRSGYLNAIKSETALDKFAKSSAKSAALLGQKTRTIEASEMRKMTGSDYYPYGVFYESGGRINPYLFTNGMVRVAKDKGARVYGETEATTVTPDGKGWVVNMKSGARVRCNKVVFCTNAYSTDVVPEFKQSCSPMTAYALSTKPLPNELRDLIMPSRATLAQVPIDLNPFIIDKHNRIIMASIPSSSRPHDAHWHFKQHMQWVNRTWPETKNFNIELEAYWTGRVAMGQQEFPGMYQLASGIYGLMHFNAWGNVMAPMMGMALAKSIAADRPDTLPFPIVTPNQVSHPGKQEFLIRNLMIPAARTAQNFDLI
ncbi:NAD(P)/FAD-dependent oxidoreductase [Cognaticolwellia beringensis]|uniref:NAD(P)/FAD-dependent oxidoreductase n=1 Tax=Cognaticolwellia beringensis TaxID=1967665 RepID=UPI001C11126A|nr:FAD-dependent oxidoreductase [Cognaticolwellia beringensis]